MGAGRVVLRYGTFDGYLNIAGGLRLAYWTSARPGTRQNQVDQPDSKSIPYQVHEITPFGWLRRANPAMDWRPGVHIAVTEISSRKSGFISHGKPSRDCLAMSIDWRFKRKGL
jgi:hypothetical protein